MLCEILPVQSEAKRSAESRRVRKGDVKHDEPISSSIVGNYSIWRNPSTICDHHSNKRSKRSSEVIKSWAD